MIGWVEVPELPEEAWVYAPFAVAELKGLADENTGD